MIVYHIGPNGEYHATDGLVMLTRCGRHPSKKQGWLVDMAADALMSAPRCRECFPAYVAHCVWCGEPENGEQGAVELIESEHWHEDCYETAVRWSKL